MSVDRSWIARSMERPGVAALVVSALDVHQQRSEVARYDLDDRTTTDDLAAAIQRDADSFASGLGGLQRFHVAAVGEDESRILASTTFAVESRALADGDGPVGSFPPTATGALALELTNNQNTMRLLTSCIGSFVTQQSTTIRELRAQNEALLNDRLETIRLIEDLQSAKHVREMEMKRLEATEARKNEMVADLLPFASAALNKVTGKQLVRQRSSEIELAAKALAGTLSMEQLDTLRESGALTTQQLVAVGSMIEALVKSGMVTTEEKAESEDVAHPVVTGEKEKKK